MKLFKFLIVGLLFTASLTSCKKEDRIEKNLWKKGGEWNIEMHSYKSVSSVSGEDFNMSIPNMGSYTFKKDGSGVYMYSFMGDVDTGMFTYSNTEDKLTMIADGHAIIYTMDWKKNNLTITNVDSHTTSTAGEIVTDTQTLILKKK